MTAVAVIVSEVASVNFREEKFRKDDLIYGLTAGKYLDSALFVYCHYIRVARVDNNYLIELYPKHKQGDKTGLRWRTRRNIYINREISFSS